MAVQGSDDEKLRTAAAQLLELMADVKAPEDLVDRRFDMGIEAVIGLLSSDNPETQVSVYECWVYGRGSKKGWGPLTVRVREGRSPSRLRVWMVSNAVT